MSYNILNYPNVPDNDSIMVADTTARNPYFRTIFSSVNPDIAVLQEVERGVDATAFLTNVMNTYGETYELGFYGTSGDDNPIYFKANKFDLISSYLVIDQAGWGHPTVEYVLYHEASGDTLIILNTHLTSQESSASRIARKIDADAIRERTSTYSDGAYFIAMGDFNMYGGIGIEAGFDTLLDQTYAGYFIDPLDLQDYVNWSASYLTEYNTYNTREGPGDYLGGGSHSGLDERFDLLLNSQSVVDVGGIMYKPGSFVNYGNDGLHNNRDINDQPNNAVPVDVADALYMASDHLPIYADFYFGSVVADSPTPGSIVFTQVGADDNDVLEFMTLIRMDLTDLKITNSEVNSSGKLVNGDGTFDLSNTPWADIAAGTFVRLGSDLINDNDASDRIIKYDGAETTPPTLYTGGDQLIAYTGSSAVPTYIAGIIWANDGWLSGPGTSHAPGTPSDIHLGTLDNYCFSGSVDGTADVTRTALIDPNNWTGSNLRIGIQDLTLSIGNGALPVELVFFAGTINGNRIELRWRTETEVNNYGFDIERASDNSNWNAIGFVEGEGNRNSPKEYGFIDPDIEKAGTYYYRLKQIDNDGTFEYSEVINVEVDVPDNFYLSQNYPNPFNPETRINFIIPQKQMVSLKIFNILGGLIENLISEEKEAGSYSIVFNASNLSSGIYVYRLETPDFIGLRKMTLLK